MKENLSRTHRITLQHHLMEGSGRSHQEGGPLKQENFICLYDLCKIPQVCLQLLDIWDELVHYARPCLQRDY